MKKVLVVLLALALALSMSSLSLAEESTLSGKVVVSVPAGTGTQEAWEAVAAKYMEYNPGVEVVVDLKPSDTYQEWGKALFASENMEEVEPDILVVNTIGSDRNGKVINFFDYIYDESPYSGLEWGEQFELDQQPVDWVNGTLDNLCMYAVQVLWFYNIDIFEEVGVEVPKTWSELVDVCEKLDAAGYQPLAVPGDYESFYSMQLGWMCRSYADAYFRNFINDYRAQPGDYMYDEEIDGVWEYDPSDPFNDKSGKVHGNSLRLYAAMRDGEVRFDSDELKEMHSLFMQVFPKYAGGENFWGTGPSDVDTLFFQQKAAMLLEGSWFFTDYLNTMDELEEDSGLTYFNVGTFTYPNVESDLIDAPLRTIEVSNGFVGAVKKNAEHDALVVDFLQFWTSAEGFGLYYQTVTDNGGSLGLPLVYGVEVADERLANMFDGINYIGNEGWGASIARGLGDNQEATRAWYTYTEQLYNGEITLDEWGELNQENQMTYFPTVLEASGITMEDLDNPQNPPTGAGN